MWQNFIQNFKTLHLWQKALFGVIVLGLIFYGLLHTGLISLPASKAYECSNVANTKTIEVDMTAKGFEPRDVTAKLCDKLHFVNLDTTEHDPAVGPHPTHTSYPGFDAKRALQQGQTFDFTLNRLGSYSFHDHLTPDMLGKLTVQK